MIVDNDFANKASTYVYMCPTFGQQHSTSFVFLGILGRTDIIHHLLLQSRDNQDSFNLCTSNICGDCDSDRLELAYYVLPRSNNVLYVQKVRSSFGFTTAIYHAQGFLGSVIYHTSCISAQTVTIPSVKRGDLRSGAGSYTHEQLVAAAQSLRISQATSDPAITGSEFVCSKGRHAITYSSIV